MRPAPAQLPRTHVNQVVSFQVDDPTGGSEQLQDTLAQGRLAGAGFSHNSQGAPLPEFQGNAIHRLQVAGNAAETPFLHRETDL